MLFIDSSVSETAVLKVYYSEMSTFSRTKCGLRRSPPRISIDTEIRLRIFTYKLETEFEAIV